MNLILLIVGALFLFVSPKLQDKYGRYSTYLYLGLLLFCIGLYGIAFEGYRLLTVCLFLWGFSLFHRFHPFSYTAYIGKIGKGLLIPTLIVTFVMLPVFVPSNSMRPNIHPGDYLAMSPWPNQDYRAGDVVVFQSPTDGRMIKRIVAVAGDTVVYQDHRLYLNQQALTQTEVTGHDRYMEMRERSAEQHQERFYMVQNETQSPVMRSTHIRQAANLKHCLYEKNLVACKVPEGHYFMMGDNRENSIDSRYYGAIPKEKIEGRALFVLFNGQELSRIFNTFPNPSKNF